MRSHVGATFGGGRYRVVSHLGSGGMATVYRATHMDLGLDVAVKFLHCSISGPDDRARFRREARLGAHLDHPNCVRVIDFSDAYESMALVMELLEGPTVRGVMDMGPLPITTAVSVGLHVLDALDHVHRRGILHRDVKPGNVMYGRRREGLVPILIDFGLAKAFDDGEIDPPNTALGSSASGQITAPGICCGSPSYIAPERIQRHRYGPASDVYGVGVLLYEMLTGERPFKGTSPRDIMVAAVRVPPRPLCALAPPLSPKLEAIVLRALEKDPDRRYRSAAEMAFDLSDVVGCSGEIEVPPFDAAPCELYEDSSGQHPERVWHSVNTAASGPTRADWVACRT